MSDVSESAIMPDVSESAIMPPTHLVFVDTTHCMFCTDPREEDLPTQTVFCCLDTRTGYTTCNACEEAAYDMRRRYNADIDPELFDLRPLLNTDIRIKRSNGSIDGGWRISSLKNTIIIRTDLGDGGGDCGDEPYTAVPCQHVVAGYSRWCDVRMIRELNTSHHIKSATKR